jgi:hypothetical protein
MCIYFESQSSKKVSNDPKRMGFLTIDEFCKKFYGINRKEREREKDRERESQQR